MPALLARLLSAIPIVLTAMPLTTAGRGWIRIWEFPRLQIAATGVVALIALSRARRSRADTALSAAVAISIAYQSWKILPYTRIASKQVKTVRRREPGSTIRLVTSNVYMNNRDGAAVLAMVESADPDVICFVEADSWWERRLSVLEPSYQYRNKCPLDNTYGMLLYSRLPLQSETRFLVQTDVPSMRSALQLPSGEMILLYCVHPRPPRETRPSYARDAELVIVAREIHRDEKPTIVLGDLNDVGWSYTTTLFQRISRTVDPRVGRGMYNTFNANKFLLRYPLDHVFHTRQFSVVRLERLSYVGSDHFPILVELAYDPGSGTDRPPLPGVTDRSNAREMLRDRCEHDLAHDACG